MEYNDSDAKGHAVAFPVVGGDCTWPEGISYKWIHLQKDMEFFVDLKRIFIAVSLSGLFIKAVVIS